MISTCLLALWITADATGTWTGTLAGVGTVHLVLKQEGKKLTGTAGPSVEQQLPVLRGEASENGALRFEVEQGSSLFKLALRVEGDAMSGEVVRERDGGTEKTTLTAKRVMDLEATVKALDQALFDAYNVCDMPKMAALFAKDVEFYHDQGGVMYGLDPVIEATKKNVCGKVRRELVSIEVYPIAGYGAIEIGSHKFYNRSSGKEEGGDKTAKFTHVWRNQGGEWKITRVMSYAH